MPLALSMTRAPAGTMACRRLISGICMRRDSNRALILRGDPFVLGKRPIEHASHHLARQVIVGRTEAATADDEVRPAQREPQCRCEFLAIVADLALADDVDPQEVELLGDEQRIRVDAGGREQFAADRDDAPRAFRPAIRVSPKSGRA